MAIGRGHSRGGRPNMGGGGLRGGSTSRNVAGGSAFRGGAGGSSLLRASTANNNSFRGNGGGLSGPRINSSPALSSLGTYGMPSSPVNININSAPKARAFGGGGGGLVSSLLGSAVSAGVGVASAAIVNKIQETSQMKLQEKQAEQMEALARQQAEQQAEYARQQAEYQLELERIKAQQEEIKRDTKQDKRYYANCPYCLGVNNGGKFCQFCGSSLAYYDDDDDIKAGNNRPEEGNKKDVQ